jgi:NADPH:quinone reductase-like Zn-dependent oxidoreductase
MSDEEAATLPCAALTAWNALVSNAQIQAGDTILVLGTGGVSIFALQLGVMHGASVIVTSSSNAKLERAMSLGAAATVNYRSHDDWDEVVLGLTGGSGVDHVVGAATISRSLSAIRPGGVVSLIGTHLAGLGGADLVRVLQQTVQKRARLQGLVVGSRAMFEEMNRALELHQLRPVIDRVFPFERAPDAYEYMERQSHFGKIVISV